MANKYIRHGETYCGDGTSSAAATSNGGVGAWNNINVFEGTAPAYGALAAGDTVYIRSKDQGGANITRTMTANTVVCSASATEDSPITWILDNGVVWAGVDGVLGYLNSGGNYTFEVRAYNNVIAMTKDALVITTANVWGSVWLALKANTGVYAKNIKINGESWTQGYGVVVRLGGAVLDSPTVLIGNLVSGGSSLFLGAESTYVTNTVINADIVVKGTDVNASIVSGSTYAGGCSYTFIGGRISGTAADNGACLVNNDSQFPIRFIGMKIPRTMRVTDNQNFRPSTVEIVGCDDDGTGGYIDEYWGWATSRTDNYPPTLSATLPNTTLTPWAWRVYPKNASVVTPMRLISSKLFTDAEAAKTVTLEFLVSTTMTTSKKSVWMTAEYIDAATGLPKHIDTRDFSAPSIDASSAAWSTTTWGMVSFTKKKLAVTTPTAIKQNTLLTVTLFGTVKSVTANDIYFVDPDFAVM